MPKAKSSASKTDVSALDCEAQLWAAADKMRGHMDTTWKLARMNLAIRGMRNADGFRQDLHPRLKAEPQMN